MSLRRIYATAEIKTFCLQTGGYNPKTWIGIRKCC